jgi:hypothetical protein
MIQRVGGTGHGLILLRAREGYSFKPTNSLTDIEITEMCLVARIHFVAPHLVFT